MTRSQTPSTATLLAAQERARAIRADAGRAAWDALPASIRLYLPLVGRKPKDAAC